MIAPRSIRGRLTLWYGTVVLFALVLFIAITAGVLYWQLYRQLSRFAIQDVETIEGLLFFAPNGTLTLNEGYHNHSESRLILERLLQGMSPDGTVLYRNWRLKGEDLGGPILPGEGVNSYSPRTVHLKDGSRVLLVSRRHILSGHPVLIRIGYREESVTARIRDLLTAVSITLPVLLSLTAVFGSAIARRALAPLDRMAHLAGQITAEQLDKRLPVANEDDEIGHLGKVVNRLLDRLQYSFTQLKRFTADASHELRTPLAAIRSVGEVGLQSETSVAGYRDIIGSMLEEVNRLTSLVESLLVISRADAGQIALQVSDFSLPDLVKEAAALIEVLAEEKQQQILVSATDVGAWHVRGDRLLLRQALVNILHNATKFSPPGSTIQVWTASERTSWIAVRVSDEGPGIAPEHRAKIFDRFYRVDEARTRETGGTGLGLALASWSVAAHGGAIHVEGDSDGGAVFVLELPAASAN